MNWQIQLTLKLLVLSASIAARVRFAAAARYNVSMAEMASCKEYDIRGTGYLYSDFFHVQTLTNNQIASDERLHLKFYVMTEMDAHILLSVNDHPRLLDRVYEVVIGAGGNTFSAIRVAMGRRRVATNQDGYILSQFDPTPIEIVQKKDGSFFVFIPGLKKEPLLNFTDASPLTINYISFSAFGVKSAKWFYDCKFDGFGNEIEQEVRPLSPRQRLIANITANAENKTMLPYLKEIHTTFYIDAVSYKEDASILTTRLELMLRWTDDRLAWQPEEFNDIKSIVDTNLDIWTPQLMVLNGALDTFRRFKPQWELRLDSFGNVLLLGRNTVLNSWCPNSEFSWPNEQLRCELMLCVGDFDASHIGPLQLVYEKSDRLFAEPMRVSYEWQIMEMGVAHIVNGLDERLSEQGKLQVKNRDMAIELVIKRNGSFYKNVYTIPLLACETLIVLSFLLRGYRRGALLLLVLLVISLSLMFITKHAPHYYIPDIMVAYQHVMRLTAFCYWLHIVIMWLELHPPRMQPCACLMSIINYSPLRLILCMRFSDATEYVSIQERPWHEIAKILNNISFIVANALLILWDVFLIPK